MDAGLPQDSGMSVLAETTLCVVSTTAETPMDAELDITLRQRGWQVIVRDDPHLAMAELCLQQRSLQSRAGWASGREQLALVVLSPGGPPAEPQQALIGAARRYLPDVASWLYAGGDLVPLHAGGPPPAPPAAPDTPRGTAGDIGVIDAAAPGPPATPDDEADPARITTDELDMLFGHVGEPPSDEGGRP
jgi:hypothetical protein